MGTTIKIDDDSYEITKSKPASEEKIRVSVKETKQRLESVLASIDQIQIAIEMKQTELIPLKAERDELKDKIRQAKEVGIITEEIK